MSSVPVVRPNDKEKQDRTVAKIILEKIGLEKEKYRLGYTKVFLLLKKKTLWCLCGIFFFHVISSSKIEKIKKCTTLEYVFDEITQDFMYFNVLQGFLP